MRYFYPDALSAKKQFLKEHMRNTLVELHLEANPDKVIEPHLTNLGLSWALNATVGILMWVEYPLTSSRQRCEENQEPLRSGKEPKVKKGGWRQEPLLSTLIRNYIHQRLIVK